MTIWHQGQLSRSNATDVPYLFLLHQFRVGTIIHHAGPEHRCRQRAVDLLGIDVAQFAIEYELVPPRPQTDRRSLPQQDKRKNVAILLTLAVIRFSIGRHQDLALAVEEKDVRINAVCNGAAKVWYPVEHQRRLIWVLENELAEDIDDNGEHNEGDEDSANDGADQST